MKSRQRFHYVPIIILGLFVFLSSCKSSYDLKTTEDQTYRFSKSITESDPGIDSLIAPYKRNLDAKMNEVIGVAAKSMFKTKPESVLGNWLTDAIRDQAKKLNYNIDFATQNYGGIRISEIPEGEVTVGQIYELMPFENMLVILEIDGKEIMKFFERIKNYGGWPVSNEVRMHVHNDKISDLSIGGERLNENRIYRIALPDYIANGGDNCVFFKDKPRKDTGILIRDLLIQELRDKTKNGSKVSSSIEGRIVIH